VIEFIAEIYKLGINPCVDIPERVSKEFGIRGNIAVLGTVNGHEFRSTLVPIGGGRHRLYVNTDMRKRAGVDVGDEIRIELKFDAKPRVVPIPEPFSLALQENPAAKGAWNKLTPSRRMEVTMTSRFTKRT
jgi:hypothetical protein